MSRKKDPIVVEYRPAGAAEALFGNRSPEVLIEGPAGTGKTRAVLEYVNYLCETYPGIRVLLFRKTRNSMSESVLVTWEEKVLWDGPPAKSGEAQRTNRQHYSYPNGSHVVLGGMDNSDRIMSTEYDIAACFEATECTQEDWEKVTTRLRNNVLPWQQGVCDCNPGSQYHWLNLRANRGRMDRLLSRHTDNPTVTPEYLAALDALSGAQRERLLHGRWVSEEGLVYDEYDPAMHIVDEPPVDMKWHFATVDWGFRAPGVFQVWGVTGDRDLYRVAEVYQTEKDYDWWADVAVELHKEFDLLQVACDPAEPRSIEMLNDRLGFPGGRDTARIATKADNDIMAGLDMVRWALRPQRKDRPRMYLVKNALRYGRDQRLDDALKPCCTEEEFPGFVWFKQADGKPIKEQPDPSCPDHGLDCVRYAAMFAWERNLDMEEPTSSFAPGSMGDILNHDEVLNV